MNSSVAARLNADLLEENYALWREDPGAVDPEWAAFFEGFALGAAQTKADKQKSGPRTANNDSLRVTQVDAAFRAGVVRMLYNYRSLGHTRHG